MPQMPEHTTKSVVVIGGGPAGLTAAVELCRLNLPVTVFEKDRLVGGIARTGGAQPAGGEARPVEREHRTLVSRRNAPAASRRRAIASKLHMPPSSSPRLHVASQNIGAAPHRGGHEEP